MLEDYFESHAGHYPPPPLNVRLVGAVSDLLDEMKNLDSAYRCAHGEGFRAEGK